MRVMLLGHSFSICIDDNTKTYTRYGAFVPVGDIYSATITREMTDFEINDIIGKISNEYTERK